MRSLGEWLREGALPPDRLLALGRALAGRLAWDHALDVARGDLHPDRILWDGGAVLELAEEPAPVPVPAAGLEALRGEEALAAAGWYAPEQIRGEKPTERTDVFVAGAILYRAATGLHPFADATAADVLGCIEAYHPSQPGDYRPGLPEGWDGVLMVSLHKEPLMRFASALDLEREIEKLARRPAVPAARRRLRGRSPRWGRIAAIFLLAAAALWALWRWLG